MRSSQLPSSVPARASKLSVTILKLMPETLIVRIAADSRRSSRVIVSGLSPRIRENTQSGLTKSGRDAYLEGIVAGSQGITGLLGSVMYRDEAYYFSRVGRNLERADMTTRLIDVRSTDLFPDDLLESRSLDTLQWISVLRSMSGFGSERREEVTAKLAMLITLISAAMNLCRRPPTLEYLSLYLQRYPLPMACNRYRPTSKTTEPAAWPALLSTGRLTG